MSGHTPGPWETHEFTDRTSITIRQVDTGHGAEDNICYVPEAWRNEANARLIAASPELLEAAKRVASNTYFSVDDEFEQLDAAIAKAEGRADEKESS
jgi:hypothetical protein